MNFVAILAIPAVFAYFSDIVGFLTDGTVPTLIRTFLVRLVTFATLNAKPRRFARLIRSVRFVTAGAEPHFLCVIALFLFAIQLTFVVFRSARRATPGILSEGIFGGMNRVARLARPAPVFTGHQQLLPIPPPLFREMNGLACVAPPGRLPNAEFVRRVRVRTNRLLMLHMARRTKPRRMRICNGKTDDRRRKQL